MNSILNSKNITNNQKNRIRKSMYEMLFLLKSNLFDNICELKITGSTLNVYTILIKDNTFICNCADFDYAHRNNMYCKHICFVICSIGKIRDERVFVNKSISEEQKQKIFVRLEDINDENITCKFLTYKYEKAEIIPRNIHEDCIICFSQLENSIQNTNIFDRFKA